MLCFGTNKPPYLDVQFKQSTCGEGSSNKSMHLSNKPGLSCSFTDCLNTSKCDKHNLGKVNQISVSYENLKTKSPSRVY